MSCYVEKGFHGNHDWLWRLRQARPSLRLRPPATNSLIESQEGVGVDLVAGVDGTYHVKLRVR